MPPEPAVPPLPDALNRLIPQVGSEPRRLQAEVWAAPAADRLALVDLRIAQLLGDDPAPWAAVGQAPDVGAPQRDQLRQWPTSPLFSVEERAVLGFTEQFVIDVAGVDERVRTELGGAIGTSRVLDLVVPLFVLDFGRRVTMVLHRLFSDRPGVGPGAAFDRGRGPGSATGMTVLDGFDRLSRSVALLDGVDPVTTELVRLRGARQHNCRLCQSTRSARALASGADEALFDSIEHYESSDMAESHKVALRLTDAVITGPASLDQALAAQVHRWFAPAQVVELVMDVMRNSGQKIAVAMAADDPHVSSGIERFEITATGDVEYLA